MVDINTTGSPTLNVAPVAAPPDYTAFQLEEDDPSPPTPSAETLKDAEYDESESTGTVVTKVEALADAEINSPQPYLEVVTTDTLEAGATDLEVNVKAGVTSGNGKVLLKQINRDAVAYAFTIAPPSVTLQRLTNYASGSLARELYDTVFDLAEAAGGSPSVETFSAFDHAAGTYTRNTSLWLSGVDLTGVIAYCSKYSNRGRTRGVMITPSVVLCCQHDPSLGTVRCVAADNTVHERTVEQQLTGPGDRALALLDSPMPSSITPVRVFDDVSDTLPQAGLENIECIPFVWQDQNLNLYLSCSNEYYNAGSTEATTANGNPYTLPQHLKATHRATDRYGRPDRWRDLPDAFFKSPVQGDSGSGVLAVPASGAPVIATAWTSPTSGPDYRNTKAWLDDRIQDLASAAGRTVSETVTEFDSTGYTSYP